MNYFTFLFLFFFSISFSQEVSGTIYDLKSNHKIDSVNVYNQTKRIRVVSKNGRFNIPFDTQDTLRLSHVGYKTAYYSLNELPYDNNYFIEIDTKRIDEIIVKNKKYSGSKKIKRTKDKRQEYFGFQFDTEHIVYIPNKEQIEGRINSIKIPLKKAADYQKNNKNWTRDYICDFKINFYEYDEVANKPSKLLNTDPVIVSPENKNYTYKIDLLKHKVNFPSNGVCVGFVVFNNNKYVKPKKTFASIGPAVKLSEKRNFKQVQAWVRYSSNERFADQGVLTDNDGRFYRALQMDLKVNYEKE